MKPSVTFVTGTYRQTYLLESAAQSVFAQTRGDWEWWIVMNGPTEPNRIVAERIAEDPRVKLFEMPVEDTERHLIRFPVQPEYSNKVYYPAVIANQYYPKIETPFFTWFSDDDLLDARFVELLAGTLEVDGSKDVVYGGMEGFTVNERGDILYPVLNIPAKEKMGLGTGIMPDCRIDSGQILQTKRSYDALGGYKIPETLDISWHSDGIYMNQLARSYTFWPVDARVLIHRRSPLSTWDKK